MFIHIIDVLILLVTIVLPQVISFLLLIMILLLMELYHPYRYFFEPFCQECVEQFHAEIKFNTNNKTASLWIGTITCPV